MSGWWEWPRPGVLVATLTTETVPTKWASSYRRLILPPHSDVTMLSGMPFGMARDAAADGCLNGGYEWLFFLDSDTCPPPDVIPRLIARGKDIVGGVYWRRAQPLVPVMLRYKSDGKEAEWVTKWDPPGSLIEVDLLGTGCMLIHRRVLERIKKPRFLWELEPEIAKAVRPTIGVAEDAAAHSEDFSFCRNAKRLYGFQIYADTSILCEHIGYASSGAAGYQPAGL